MSLTALVHRRRHAAYGLGLLMGIVVLAANGFSQPHLSAQSADSIYVTPASGSYTAGSNFTLSIRVNTGSAVNAAQAEMSYSSNLEFVSVDGSGSAFGIDASSSGGSGSISIARATITPVSGDQLLSRVTFRVVDAGAAVVSMNPGSQALSSTTNTDVIKTRNGGNYTLKASATPTPATPTPATTSTVKPVSGASAISKPATTIATQGNPTTTPLPGDSKVELQAAATVQTTTDDTRQVTKVEYSINGKLVKTDDTPPYSQSLDVTHMRNGTYKLTTKTCYQDGKTDSSTASLVVNNPFGLTQLWLQIKHFAWLVVILLIIIGELLYMKFFRKPKSPYGGYGVPAGTPGAPGANVYPSNGGFVSPAVAPGMPGVPVAPIAPVGSGPTVFGPQPGSAPNPVNPTIGAPYGPPR